MAVLLLVMGVGCGQAASQGAYVNGVPHGEWTYFYANGQRQKAGAFANGRETGPWTFWYEGGSRKQSGAYKDGREEGPWAFWYESGQRAKEGAFHDGVEQGPWTFWHENGQVARTGTFLEGQESGVWTQWDDHGRERQIIYYNKLSADLAALVEAIKRGDATARAEAQTKLAAMGVPGLAALGALLKADDVSIRVYAAESLGRLGEEGRAGADSLVALVSDPAEPVRNAGFEALVKLGKGAVVGLQRGLLAGDPNVRRESARALGRIGPDAEPAMASLESAMNDPVIEVAQEAADALGRVGKPSSAILTKLFQSPNPLLRGLAGRGLAAQAATIPESLQLLLNKLTETDPVAANALAESLGRCRDVSLAPLLAALDHPDETVRRNASRGIGKIGKPAVQPLADIVVGSQNERRRIWAAISLGEIGPPAASALPVLRRAQSDQPVRFYADEAIRKIEK